MEYLAFRIDASSIKDHKVVSGFFVRGQRSTDYNWPLLGEFPDMAAAKNFICSTIVNPERQFVYGPGCYGIKIIEMHETFYSRDEALACLEAHKSQGAEMTSRDGHRMLLNGEWTYVVPEDRPSWVVDWIELQ